jgi:hypothetical protein
MPLLHLNLNRIFIWVVFVGALVVDHSAFSIERGHSSSAYARPFPIVFVPTGADSAHKKLAQEIAEAIGTKAVAESKSNPVCCIWVEMNGYVPNPGDRGYVIINNGGGSLVSAADLNQLRAAVARFKKSIRRVDGNVEVPIGMLTNYRVVTETSVSRVR